MKYLAFGDSMSIDTYPLLSDGVRGFPSLIVENDDGRFSDFRGRDLRTLHRDVVHENFAVDGATSEQVLATQLPRAASRLASGADLVTLTIGGNDLLATGLALIGERAAMDASAVAARFDDAAARFGGRLRGILRELRAHASTVLVGTIYDPTDGTGRFTDPTFSAGFGMLLSPEATVRMLGVWNGMIVGAAFDTGARLVDIHRHFLGHGNHSADSGSPYHDAADPTRWTYQTIEPNGRGAHELRRCFWETLARR